MKTLNSYISEYIEYCEYQPVSSGHKGQTGMSVWSEKGLFLEAVWVRESGCPVLKKDSLTIFLYL